ncbi:PLP-dependent aminotransferase family protein [Roseospirillum parvum]|uniref:DNA-binding transcriptional regulator, MocR family, contains an aminotransferase domain n=1 Tax=Roseospirillum parvum TaxID=83401 RepID=A0A1G8E238_9PROT|nr:PLP-dependent aminotransferase family protein [Roseospirillum parvum]SDH64006.1 DNA-binding transcriptional regulator, MocR family, contains an aminotransferase domain [Roseospirillum parvum]
MAIWHPSLDGRRGPRYRQLLDALAEDIAAGRLAPGDRLPAYRDLAFDLGLAASTVSRAYAEGVKRALLRGEVGRGTFVRTPEPPARRGSVGDLRRPTDGPIDLARNLPCPGLAEPHLRRVLGELAGAADLRPLLDRQTDSDLGRHAEAARLWLAGAGVAAYSDELVRTNGAQHGILCTLAALLAPGDLLLTEALTYAPVRALAERLGLHVQPLALDHGGLCPDAFAEACRQGAPKALYLTPTLQSPTTVTLSPERRAAVVEVARRHGVWLIEDDVFGLLKPDRPPPLAALAPERTVYLSSLSKCVAPGLRVGWLRAPAELAPALRQAVGLSVWMTAPLGAEIAARLIEDGTAERLTETQRATARRRQALAAKALAGHAVMADPHGLHLWLELPGAWKADALRAEAARRGVLISQARAFAAPGAPAPNAVRLCLSHEADEARLSTGLERLKTLLAAPPVGEVVV